MIGQENNKEIKIAVIKMKIVHKDNIKECVISNINYNISACIRFFYFWKMEEICIEV